MRVRYSQYHVTINTNHAARTAAEEEDLSTRLQWVIQNVLSRPESWDGVFDIRPSFDSISTISLNGIGIQRGGRQHFIHTHFVLVVQHSGTIKRVYQPVLQGVVHRAMPYLKGIYVKMTLMKANNLNYTAKESDDPDALFLGVQDALVF